MKRTMMLVAAGTIPSLAGAQTYTLQDLGTLAGQSEAFAVGLGSSAIGASTGADAHFRGSVLGGAPVELPGLFAFHENYAFGSDSLGRIYGSSYTLGGMTAGAFRVDDGIAAGLGAFTARAVNGAGVVAGSRGVPASGLTVPQACWFDGGTLTTLPTLGGLTGTGLAIDEDGRIAGSSSTANEASVRPCVWVGGVPHDLGTLGGSNGQAAAIRGALVVGHSQDASGTRRATAWTIDGSGAVVGRADLGALGNSSSFALGLNGAGDAVGTSGFHAVLWRNGQTIDLNAVTSAPPGWLMEKAWAIADDGVIVGTGNYLGFPRAFRLVPDGAYCPADFDHNGYVNGDDFDTFTRLFDAGDQRADVDMNGFMNGDDFDTFMLSFDAGC